jgi:hypothetical protein
VLVAARLGGARQDKGASAQKDRDMNTTTIKIHGLTPLLMHSGRLADPLDPATIALAKLTSKRNKTLDDHKALSKCEWYGGLYLDGEGAPCLPGEVIEAALVEGAKKFKLGKVAKGGIVVDGDFAIVFEGPKNVDKLWAHGGFLKRAGVRVGQSRVIRSRPIFPEWSCSFVVQWDPTLVKDEEQIQQIAESAGVSGICEWRQKFGRFEVVAQGMAGRA